MQHRSILISLLAAVLTSCAASTPTNTPEIPAGLQVPPKARLMQKLHGAGVQVYHCQSDDGGRFAWQLQAPDAELYDHDGNKVGKHYAGPTWEALDGSRVVGEVVSRDTGPDPSAVPWLLLSAKASSGTGIFTQVRYIQRLRTIGGIAPAVGCNKESVEAQLRVAYSAEYWFYSGKP